MLDTRVWVCYNRGMGTLLLSPPIAHPGSPEPPPPDGGALPLASPCLSCPHAPFRDEGSAQKTIALLRQEIEELKGKVQFLNQELFGKKSEKGLLAASESDPASLPEPEDPPPASEVNRLMCLDEEPEERLQRKKGQQPGRKSSGRTLHTDLPTSVDVHEPPLRAGPSCQAPFASYGSPEEGEILEVTVRAHRRIICRPRFRKTCSCVDTPKTTIAPPPPASCQRASSGSRSGPPF